MGNHIFKGTTPSITFRIKNESFDLNNVDILWLTFKTAPNSSKVFEKTFLLSDCIVDYELKTITVKLSQEDTLSLSAGKEVEMQIRLKMNDENAWATTITSMNVERILKGGII